MTARTTLQLPGVRLEALTWGAVDSTAPLAVLLHGFPDTAHTWRHLGPALASAGHRVVAPFTRGYGPSGVPADGRLDVGALMADAVAVHAALGGGGDAVLVGHDWGAITANALAAHPDTPYARTVAMSVPPLSAMRRARTPGLLARQARNSWYIGLNQLPWAPERFLEPLVRKLWADWSPGYDASEDLRHVLVSLHEPAHRRAAIDYYRRLARPVRVPAAYRRWQRSLWQAPAQPVLYLHGADDGCLDIRLADRTAEVLPAGSTVAIVEGAGHFLQLEQPDTVAAQVLGFLERG